MRLSSRTSGIEADDVIFGAKSQVLLRQDYPRRARLKLSEVLITQCGKARSALCDTGV